MKSFIYGAQRALDAQLQAIDGISKAIHVAHVNGIELEHQWLLDHKMLVAAEPFAWAKETTMAVLAASRSIPLDTEFNSLNLGTESIWWHFEEKLPWQTTIDGSPGIRAICMAPTHYYNRQKTRVTIPAGSDISIFEKALDGDPAVWQEPVTQYGISAWIDGSRRAELSSNDGLFINVGLLDIIPSQTFNWNTGDTMESTLRRCGEDHDKLYGPTGPWHDKPIIGRDKFLLAAEGMARFILAGLTWIHQKVVVCDVQHIERHARKRAERSLKKPPNLRLVQLRRTEYSRPEPAEGEKHREYSIRWTVDGHWRNQKVGVGRKETKLTWVMPYVKGPADKPLVISPKKVYVVSR